MIPITTGGDMATYSKPRASGDNPDQVKLEKNKLP